LLNLDWLAPGHGFLMDQPRRAVESIIAHRLRREAKVLNALPVQGTVDLHTLLERVYDDVRPQLLPIARRSLQAHLNKLANEGLALVQEGHWSRGASPR
jgi:hypothetical protein